MLPTPFPKPNNKHHSRFRNNSNMMSAHCGHEYGIGIGKGVK